MTYEMTHETPALGPPLVLEMVRSRAVALKAAAESFVPSEKTEAAAAARLAKAAGEIGARLLASPEWSVDRVRSLIRNCVCHGLSDVEGARHPCICAELMGEGGDEPDEIRDLALNTANMNRARVAALARKALGGEASEEALIGAAAHLAMAAGEEAEMLRLASGWSAARVWSLIACALEAGLAGKAARRSFESRAAAPEART